MKKTELIKQLLKVNTDESLKVAGYLADARNRVDHYASCCGEVAMLIEIFSARDMRYVVVTIDWLDVNLTFYPEYERAKEEFDIVNPKGEF